MTDLPSRLRLANPVSEHDLAPSFQAFWTQIDAPAPRQHWSTRPLRRGGVGPRRPWRAPRPLMFGSVSSVLVAATLGIVLLSAGGSPSAAQAFPILTTATVQVRTRAVVAPGQIAAFVVSAAHSFVQPYGNAYVAETTGGTRLCLLVPPIAGSACVSTHSLEQHGALFTINGPAGSPDAFIAFVPTGGALTVTANGRTRAVRATDGVATGVVNHAETLAIRVGSSITTEALTPDSPTSSFRHSPLARGER